MQNKRIVVKIGTSTLAHPSGLLNIRQVESLCKVLSDLKNAGHELILVSPGAIGMGVGKRSLSRRPEDMPTKQAAAAVGQCELMYTYDKLFSEYGHVVAQVLLSGDDIHDPQRSTNVKSTIQRLLELHALPILNENDAVSAEEIGEHTTIGENDTLAAQVAVTMGADLLVILSDINGLYSADPRTNADAQVIREVHKIDEHIEQMAGGAGSALGSGGMATKINAAKIATEAGVDMVIMNGRDPEQLYALFDGEPVGTHFMAE